MDWKYKSYAPVIVRIGLSVVFLWFGLNQVFNTEAWLSWVPAWTSNLPVKMTTLIIFNGIFEVIFGALLLIGLFTRISALLLALHLVNIIFSLGYGDIAVRDFGLMLATLSVFLHGPDKLCLDKKFFSKNK